MQNAAVKRRIGCKTKAAGESISSGLCALMFVCFKKENNEPEGVYVRIWEPLVSILV
ncbi:hypothetical protein [Paenibacillus puldeungensis]|uniref:hypothetical protein n=1 Tax=Paenibacillus puldeungensis TaxID=696536 RepID=UPI0036D32505